MLKFVDEFIRRFRKVQIRHRVKRECQKESTFMNAWNQPKGLLTTAPGTLPDIDKSPFNEIALSGEIEDIKFLERLLCEIPNECAVEDMDLEGHVYSSETYTSKSRDYLQDSIEEIKKRYAHGFR